MNLNPLDLRGPDFLVFYLVFMVATTLVVWAYRWHMESGSPGEEVAAGKEIAEDPYQVAYLRGGRDEVIRVAVISLIERGLLQAEAEKLVVTDPDAADKVRRNLDKAILMMAASDGRAQSLYSHDLVLREADLIAEPLRKLRLLSDERIKTVRIVAMVAAVGLLWLVAGAKIAVALSRGRTNILFLIILAVVAPVAVGLVTLPRVTALGRKTCNYLQTMFARLRDRRETFQLTHTTSELTFLAAVF